MSIKGLSAKFISLGIFIVVKLSKKKIIYYRTSRVILVLGYNLSLVPNHIHLVHLNILKNTNSTPFTAKARYLLNTMDL